MASGEYFRSEQLLSARVAIAAGAMLALGYGGVAAKGKWEALGAGPLFLVLAYGIAAGTVNRDRVRAGAGGVRTEFGPLPAGIPAREARREEIVRVYVRKGLLPGKHQMVPYLAAGVECRDGRRLDVTQPQLPDAVVRQEAAELAAALGWRGPVEELAEAKPELNLRWGKAMWAWAGAMAVAAGWGCFVQLSLRTWR